MQRLNHRMLGAQQHNLQPWTFRLKQPNHAQQYQLIHSVDRQIKPDNEKEETARNLRLLTNMH